MAILLDGLVEGWETLQLAAIQRDREVRSLVRLNKQLAYLQREGYPIPIAFRNIEMGPASLEVRRRAERAGKQGLLELKKTPMGEGLKDLESFALTNEGRKYVQSEVMPALQGHVRSKLFLDIFTSTMSEIQFKKNPELIEGIHKSLRLDDREEFQKAFVETKQRVDEWRKKIDETWRPKTRLEVAAGSTVEFASMALEAAQPLVADEHDDSTGKHNVVWNCERLVELLQMMEGLNGKGKAHENALTNGFDRVLNALEVNCAVYDILHVPDDEEIGALFAEAPAYHPDEVTF